MSDKQQEFDSGMMVLHITGGEDIEIDIFRMKMALEEFEEKHQPYDKEGKVKADWVMNLDRVNDLLAATKKAGVEGISSSLAFDIWGLVNKHWGEAKKKWNFLPSSPESSESAPQDSAEAS